MRKLMTCTAILALTAMPFVAEAKGKDKGGDNGGGKHEVSRGNGNGNNGNGRGNGRGNGHGNNGNNGQSARDAGKDNGHKNNRGHEAATLGRIAAGALAANGLIYLTPDVDFATITDSDLQAIANCPPGLAKKDPPCVPPGLAKKGTTYDEWVSYDADELRGLLDDRWTAYDPQTAPTVTPGLTQAQIIDLFDLPAAPAGQQYAVIDGRPVLLDADDFDRLLTLNNLATRPALADGVQIVPDSALTQAQLIDRYGLPAPAAGQNYTVLDNQVIALPDQEYDLLQLIRILGAV